MATAGYSGTPLIQKLGIKPAMKILVLHAPENYFQLLQSDISKQFAVSNENPDFIHLFFCKNEYDIQDRNEKDIANMQEENFSNYLGILV